MRYLLIALHALLSTGCASMNNAADPGKLAVADIPAGSGVMLMSAGAPERCIAMGTSLNLYREHGPDSHKAIRMLAVDAYVLKSDFTTHQGNVHALVRRRAPTIASPLSPTRTSPRPKCRGRASPSRPAPSCTSASTSSRGPAPR